MYVSLQSPGCALSTRPFISFSIFFLQLNRKCQPLGLPVQNLLGSILKASYHKHQLRKHLTLSISGSFWLWYSNINYYHYQDVKSRCITHSQNKYRLEQMVPTIMLNEDTVSYRHCKIWQVLYLKIYISWRQRSFKWWLNLEEIKNIRLFNTSRMSINDRSLQKKSRETL